MKNTIKTILLGTAVIGFSTTSLVAHRAWILPSMTVLSGEGPWVTFDAAISNDLFFPNHHAMGLDGIKVVNPKGEEVEIQYPSEGEIRSTFELQLTENGTYKVGAERKGLTASWQEGEERKRWRGGIEEFKAEGLADKEGISLSQNFSRNLTYVTKGAPDKVALKTSGEGLEIDFTDTHPNDLFTGEDATFTLLFNGKPAKGVTVQVFKGDDRFRDDSSPIEATTDEEGKFSISWETAGRYWLTARAEGEDSEVEGMTVSNRASLSATFEVLPL